ncbi:MAG: hypothetical protein H6569_06000 [Lewinellaceae bacterium]|nr:hypothetical protein [Lewinellaceae bacterium]
MWLKGKRGIVRHLQSTVQPAVRPQKPLNPAVRHLTLCDAQIKWYRTQAYYDSAEWRGTMDLDGGGALMNQVTPWTCCCIWQEM